MMIDGQLITIIGGTVGGVTFTLKMIDYIGAQVASRRNGHDSISAPVDLTTKVAVLEEHVEGKDRAVVLAIESVQREIGQFKDQHGRDLSEIKTRLGRIEAKT